MGQEHPEKIAWTGSQLLKKKNRYIKRHKETLDQTKMTAMTYQLCGVYRQEIGLERLQGIGCK